MSTHMYARLLKMVADIQVPLPTLWLACSKPPVVNNQRNANHGPFISMIYIPIAFSHGHVELSEGGTFRRDLGDQGF